MNHGDENWIKLQAQRKGNCFWCVVGNLTGVSAQSSWLNSLLSVPNLTETNLQTAVCPASSHRLQFTLTSRLELQMIQTFTGNVCQGCISSPVMLIKITLLFIKLPGSAWILSEGVQKLKEYKFYILFLHLRSLVYRSKIFIFPTDTSGTIRYSSIPVHLWRKPPSFY